MGFAWLSSFLIASLAMVSCGEYQRVPLDVGYRLPKHVKPEMYFVEIRTNLENDTFEGTVTITMTVLEDSSNITLHVKDLNLTYMNLVDEGNELQFTTERKPEYDFLIIKPKYVQLTKGHKYKTTMKFAGNLRNPLKYGYYLSTYVDERGKLKKLAITQLEATNARRAFPCFDELIWKANFTVVLCHDEKYVSGANMPLLRSSPGKFPNEKCDHFATSMKMSTYLVAFFVSDYSSDADGSYRVFTRRQWVAENRTKYALKTAKAALAAMEDYTGLKYPIGKMDLVSVPNRDFNVGAMENWGLNTYCDQALVYHETKNSVTDKRYVAETICHEFSHQWFGDLVTPVRHKYIWLNEGFASYFEWHLLAKFEKEWESDKAFLVEAVHNVMKTDWYESGRTMNTDAESPEEISKLYDDFTYKKPASIIRMMEHVLTSQVFQRGLQLYLEEMQYNNSVSGDLYRNWQKASDQAGQNLNVTAIMDSWENQEGFPVVQVNRSKNGRILVEQSRLFLKRPGKPWNTVYVVPINFATESSPDFKNTKATHWLKTKSDELRVNVSFDEWFILNKQQTGYYRVNYDEHGWRLIGQQLKANFRKIHVLNRAQLIDDVFSLARANKTTYGCAFDLIAYAKNETDHVPIASFVSVVNFLNPLLYGTSIYDNFKDYVVTILGEMYQRVGFDALPDDGYVASLTRKNILSALCALGFEECNEKSAQLVTAWRRNAKNVVHPDKQGVAFCYGTKNKKESTNKANWKFLLKKCLETHDINMRSKLATGLGCIDGVENLYEVLKVATDEETIKKETISFEIINSIVANNKMSGVEVTLGFLDKYFAAVKTRFSNRNWGLLFANLGYKINSKVHLNLMQAFLDNHTDDLGYSLQEDIRSAIRKAEINIDWLHSTLPGLEGYFGKSKHRKNRSPSNIASVLLIASSFIVKILLI